MNAAKHSPGLLHTTEVVNDDEREILLCSPNGCPVAIVRRCGSEDRPNAERFAAAWNACSAISTEALQIGVVDTLMTALDKVLARYKLDGIPNDSLATVQAASAVLDTARGIAS